VKKKGKVQAYKRDYGREGKTDKKEKAKNGLRPTLIRHSFGRSLRRAAQLFHFNYYVLFFYKSS